MVDAQLRTFRVAGEFPKVLYKCYDKREYAERFVEEGCIRAGSLNYYATIECESRCDPTEGEGHYQIPGPVTEVTFFKGSSIAPVIRETEGIQQHHVISANKVFAFCCTNQDVNMERMRSKFGKYIVQIYNPVRLAIDLDLVLNESDGKANYQVIGSNIVYNKGELIKGEQENIERLDWAYIQKAERFTEEMEFRYCLIKLSPDDIDNPDAEKHINIRIGKKINYARIL